MALTRLDFTGDGSTVLHDVSFDLGYMREDFVYVYLDGNDYDDQLSYTWVSSTQIQLDEAVESGQEYHIRRVVPRNEPVNDYEAGAILRETNLDNSFLQPLMIQEEVDDGYLTTDLDTFTFPVNVNMDGYSLSNLPDAIEDQQPVTLSQLTASEDEATATFVNTSGDTLTGTLGGVYATEDNHFMPRAQLEEVVSARVEATEYLYKDYEDYGSIAESIDDINDYGSL